MQFLDFVRAPFPAFSSVVCLDDDAFIRWESRFVRDRPKQWSSLLTSCDTQGEPIDENTLLRQRVAKPWVKGETREFIPPIFFCTMEAPPRRSSHPRKSASVSYRRKSFHSSNADLVWKQGGHFDSARDGWKICHWHDADWILNGWWVIVFYSLGVRYQKRLILHIWAKLSVVIHTSSCFIGLQQVCSNNL